MAGPLYMDAEIRLNRSLSPGGFRVLLGAVVAVNTLFAVFLFAIGAWPAPIFLGLDVLAIWLAFRASFRAAERAERVRVSAEAVTVTREGRTVWTSPTAFTRLAADTERVRLMLSGRSYTVARALSPDERSAFAAALERAIGAARAERHTT